MSADMYYIYHGEDEFSITEAVKKLQAGMGDPQFLDLNTARLDKTATLGELRHACDAVPFLADKRLVIVEGLLANLEPKRKKGTSPESAGTAEREAETPGAGGNQAGTGEAEEPADPEMVKGLKEYLPLLPESTSLVFVEPRLLAANNPILKLAKESKKKATVAEFKTPAEGALPHWIQERVQAKEGKIEGEAIRTLVMHVGPDYRLLDNEIEKLLTYRGQEPVRAEDVERLVASVRETKVFELVDAVGRRERNAALRLLHGQIDQGEQPLYLLAMIVRQFRLLLQVKDLGARGLTRDAVREQLKQHPFVIQKVSDQAQRFTLPQLEAIYRRLLETDVSIKTGRSDPVLALDLLIAELTG